MEDRKMYDIQVQIEFHSSWHCGSGLSAGADLDTLVIKDHNGMPFLPGKTFKGLVREAVEEYIRLVQIDKEKKELVEQMFGKASSNEELFESGTAHFTDATLCEQEYQSIVADNAQCYLYNKVTTTAIDENGIARDHSLHSMQTVVPCTLHATIYDVPDELEKIVAKSLGMIKHLGQKRHRGFGRCTVSVEGEHSPATRVVVAPSENKRYNTRLQFQCELISDVVLNQKSSTEGVNATLDFIPGNVFLGIVAKQYQYFEEKGQAMKVFHSGSVRFGDAHPVAEGAEDAGHNPVRSLRVPASFYYPKLKSPTDGCYIHHFYSRETDKGLNNGKAQQLKQCRKGFYAFVANDGGYMGYPASTERIFAIKSAYDRSKRRSQDGQIYGYESLRKGTTFFFEVEVDDELLSQPIAEALIGKHRIGRSRTAQYGLVNIQEACYKEVQSSDRLIEVAGKRYAVVYADSRLIFLDDNQEPTFRPTAEQLGITGGEIDWTLSQVRIFQYAPWNGVRSVRDTDRCGIEKGSVFVVKMVETASSPSVSSYVGNYKNEGFGRVIYNPAFLFPLSATNGEAQYKLQDVAVRLSTVAEQNSKKEPNDIKASSFLLHYINDIKKREEIDRFIYQQVNKFVDQTNGIFNEDRFASQWGALRAYAMQYTTDQDIITKVIGEDMNSKNESAYLTHGVSKEKWKKFGRWKMLKGYVAKVQSEAQTKHYGDILSRALINLSSEMAKNSK